MAETSAGAEQRQLNSLRRLLLLLLRLGTVMHHARAVHITATIQLLLLLPTQARLFVGIAHRALRRSCFVSLSRIHARTLALLYRRMRPIWMCGGPSLFASQRCNVRLLTPSSPASAGCV